MPVSGDSAGVELPGWHHSPSIMLPTTGGTEGQRGVIIDDTTWAQIICSRAFLCSPPPTASRKFISYRMVPAPIRFRLASLMARYKRNSLTDPKIFPAWPLDLTADVVADIRGLPNPIAQSGTTPVILTHDLDSVEGVRNFSEHFLPIEEEVGAKSHNFVVPHEYPLDFGILEGAVARGHGIGVHGFDHSNRTAFLPQDRIHQRLTAGLERLASLSPRGYRAPSLVRSRALYPLLEQFHEFDSSIPTTGGLFPVVGNGCATARPFRIGKIVELPISMPRDGHLLFLGLKPNQVLELWQQAASRIAASKGIVTLLTHCENHFSGNSAMLSAYRQFLEWLANDGNFHFTSPINLIDDLQLKTLAPSITP